MLPKKRIGHLAKGFFDGETAFLIGNGPSLNLHSRQEFQQLATRVTFGSNAIYLNYQLMGFLPTFFMVEDTLVAEDRAKDIISLRGPTKIFGEHLRYCLGADRQAVWANIHFRYDRYPNFPNWGDDWDSGFWVGGTVSYLHMQLAAFLGVQTLVLVGFDHEYHVPDGTALDGNTYTSQSEDPNHFNPDYFGPGKRWHRPQLDRMELAYERAKIEFENRGRRILNATIGGGLNVFDRTDLSNHL